MKWFEWLFDIKRDQSGANRGFAFMLLAILGLAVLTGCGGSPADVVATRALDERPTDTPLPPAPSWRVASQPITTDNVPQLSLLGRLEAPGTPTTIFSWALSPDNTQLVGLNNSFILAWDLVTGRLIFSASRQDTTHVYYSPDKDAIFAVAVDGSVSAVSSTDGTIVGTVQAIDGYNDVTTYDPDEGILALAATNGDIKVWDLLEPEELIALPGSGSQPVSMAFSPDHKLLAVAYDLGVVLVWDWRAQTVKAVPVMPDDESGIVGQLRFSPDGQSLIGMTDSIGLVWNIKDGGLRYVLPVGNGGSDYLFKVSPQGNYVITGGTAKDTTLWDIVEGRLASALPDVGGDNVDAVFSPDGNLLFTSLFSGEVVLWNLQNLAEGSIARSVQPIENSNILNLIWTDDGFLVLLIDARGPIEVWGIP